MKFEVGVGYFYAERGSARLYGGLGAKPPVGSRGKAPGQGVWEAKLPRSKKQTIFNSLKSLFLMNKNMKFPFIIQSETDKCKKILNSQT